MDVMGGSSVSNDNCVIGEFPGSEGVAAVSGAGSRWENASDLTVGGDGIGALNISRGGLVSVGSKLEVRPSGIVTVEAGGRITVGDCPRLTPANAVAVCPGGTLANNGTINARIVEIPGPRVGYSGDEKRVVRSEK